MTVPVASSGPVPEGCDCAELCSMGPTCPGGMLARLPGSGCWRSRPDAEELAEFLAENVWHDREEQDHE